MDRPTTREVAVRSTFFVAGTAVLVGLAVRGRPRLTVAAVDLGPMLFTLAVVCVLSGLVNAVVMVRRWQRPRRDGDRT